MTTRALAATKLDQALSLTLHRHALQAAGQVLLMATSVGLLTSFGLIALIWRIGL